MREHMGLYRGKRVDNCEWITGHLLKVTLQGKTAHLIFGDNFSFVGGDVKALSHALVDPDTVGECTGLRDKNGKLIFEGDRVLGLDPTKMILASIEVKRRPVTCVETGVSYYSMSEAARATGVHVQNIWRCVQGKTKTAGSYHWKEVS